jgi:hypothetical protein
MSIHLAVLGRLHVLLGSCASLAGIALALLAGGTAAGLPGPDDWTPAARVSVSLLLWSGGLLLAGGLTLVFIGRALSRQRPSSRNWALCAAIPNLLMVPFGTALSVYTFWVLLNDDARRLFGVRMRGSKDADH